MIAAEFCEDVIKFIGFACDDEDIALAVEQGSFENMRKNEETYGAEPYSGTKGERGYFVRNGKVDGWKKELPASSGRPYRARVLRDDATGGVFAGIDLSLVTFVCWSRSGSNQI